jgi:hypothetical protein
MRMKFLSTGYLLQNMSSLSFNKLFNDCKPKTCTTYNVAKRSESHPPQYPLDRG